jgi:hypothetical protein
VADRPTIDYADAKTPRPAPPVKDYGHVAFSHETCAKLERILFWLGVGLLILIASGFVWVFRSGEFRT